MEQNEVKELMAEIGKAIDKSSSNMWLIYPTLQCYDSEAKGIKLGIKQSIVKSRELLESIVEKRKLKIITTEEDFIIYTPRKNV
jgi:hypothetical protein